MSLVAIQHYQNELQKVKDYSGSSKETAIRNSFYNLLNHYASQNGLILIPELSIKTSTGRTITPDGTLKDSLRLDWGYWESKDEDDDIDLEIKKKFAKGYPKDNILFEDSQIAILFQGGREVIRADVQNALALDSLIKSFVNYQRPEVANFRAAIELFKSDIPNVVTALRNMINEQLGSGGQGIGSEDKNAGSGGQGLDIDNSDSIIDNHGENNEQNNELSESKSLGRSDEPDSNDLRIDPKLSKVGNVRTDQPDQKSGSVSSSKHSGGLRQVSQERVSSPSVDSQGLVDGSGNTSIDSSKDKLHKSGIIGTDLGKSTVSGQTSGRTSKIISNLKPDPNTQAPKPLNQKFITKLLEFHEICKQSINPEITLDDINEMMIQHILTADIFNTIFDEPYFHRENNIAKQLETVINTFFTRQIRENLLSKINIYYQAINVAAAGIADHHEKQKFLKIVYENFYKSYNPKAADRLGVVYTPNEIVRFMIESTDYLLHKHFGRFLSDKNVEILDPATGTGTFICDLIDYLPKDKLEYKYKNEIHANEVAILPYYIANLNIEFTYKQRMEEYAEFKNLCFVDTLDNMGFDYKNKVDELFSVSAENTERIKKQNERKISVIIGNPPYNANQMNENDNNKNREYPIIDKRIKDTYIKHSTAQKTKVYDMYSRFYRWAMDRLGDEGIIAFITNRSFINSRTFDGFRKIVASEFDHIYIIDLGGDVRANPKLSGPKHNVFAIQTGVAIMLLVKTSDNSIYLAKSDEEEFNYLKKSLKLTPIAKEPVIYYDDQKYISPKGCRIFYIRRPEMETAEDKFSFLSQTKIHDLIRNGTFDHIRPDKNNNWIELTENDWETMIPVANKETKLSKNQNDENALFKLFSLGVVTARDEWVYDFDKKNIEKKVKFLIDSYNNDVKKLKDIAKTAIKDNINYQIKWSRAVKNDLFKGKKYIYNNKLILKSLYRPFVLENLYFAKELNEMQYQLNSIFHSNSIANKLICFLSGNRLEFCINASKYLPNYALYSLDPAQCLPLYRFDSDGNRFDNITDWGLNIFRARYETEALNPEPNTLNPITKEDIFHYVYAVLHNTAYRKKYEMNLKREFPRVPFYDDFWKWADWGKKLMDLHINFETVEKYPLRVSGIVDRVQENDNSETLTPNPNTQLYKPKLKADKDSGTIELDNITTLSGVPKEAWEYKLGNRSALEWILDQYKEKKPKDPTIAEKFNTYRFADYKDKVIDLLMRVTTVSVETVKIVREMGR